MILAVNRTLGAKCPVCNENIITEFTPFEINYNLASVCDVCNKSFATIKKGRNGNYILSVECYICEETHNYEISRSALLKSDLLAFGCHSSGIDICYIGDGIKVENALRLLDDTLDEMTGEMAADVIPEISDVMKEGLAIIDSIAVNNKIACPCGKCELTLRLCRSGITVSCGACGASEFIKIENQDDIRNFKLRKSIKLI